MMPRNPEQGSSRGVTGWSGEAHVASDRGARAFAQKAAPTGTTRGPRWGVETITPTHQGVNDG